MRTEPPASAQPDDNPHIGSDFDNFLTEEGIREEVETLALLKIDRECQVVRDTSEPHGLP